MRENLIQGHFIKMLQVFALSMSFFSWFPFSAIASDLALPAQTKTLKNIVLDIKAPLNVKLEDLRKNYRIREIKKGVFDFYDKNGVLKLKAEVSRSLNQSKTEKSEVFTYRNWNSDLLFEETVITKGKNLDYADFEKRLFQTGVENYDLETEDVEYKTVKVRVDKNRLFEITSTRSQSMTEKVKTHQISLGAGNQFVIRDKKSLSGVYRVYEYQVMDPNASVSFFSNKKERNQTWRGYLKINVMKFPSLLLPEFTYEMSGSTGFFRPNGFENFSSELHNLFITRWLVWGIVDVFKWCTAQNWIWPESKSIQSIGSDSVFLNELIVIRNQVNQARTNPTLLQEIERKIRVFITDIQGGKLKINDFR